MGVGQLGDSYQQVVADLTLMLARCWFLLQGAWGLGGCIDGLEGRQGIGVSLSSV